MPTTRKTSETPGFASADDPADTASSSAGRSPLGSVTDKVRDLNQRMTRSYREVGLAGVSAYDRAIKAVADLETKTASVAKVGWVESAIRTHSELVQDLGASYSKAARSLLA